jgi:hypothetical protein
MFSVFLRIFVALRVTVGFTIGLAPLNYYVIKQLLNNNNNNNNYYFYIFRLFQQQVRLS